MHKKERDIDSVASVATRRVVLASVAKGGGGLSSSIATPRVLLDSVASVATHWLVSARVGSATT